MTANGSSFSNATLAWLMNGTHFVVWLNIREPLITVHFLLVCIFIFIVQYLHVSYMALTAAAVMNSEQTIYLLEGGNMDFFHVCHLLKPCIAPHSIGGHVEGSVSAQWIYCIPLYVSLIQKSTIFITTLSDSDSLWLETILNLFKISLILILCNDSICTAENTIPVNAI